MKNDQNRNPFPKVKGEKAEIVTANAVGAGFKPVPTKPRFVEMSVMFFHANRQPLATKHCFSTLKGFTLLETLVALAIIGIAMAAAMRVQAGQQQAEKIYAFDVKPRWPLDSIVAPSAVV